MMKTEIKTALVLAIVIAVGVGAMSVIFSSLDQTVQDEPATTVTADGYGVHIDKSRFKQAPSLTGIAHHINTTPEELSESIKESVVLYDIWTYSCINCIRTLPFITAWDEKYADRGLLIIGVHSPEFEFEKDPENVMQAVQKHGIEYPVVMDNDMETWNAFENKYWPRKYIADHEGYIRYDHIGEGGYAETEKMIQHLLAERDVVMADGTDINIGAGSSADVDTSMSNLSTSEMPLVDIAEFEHTLFRTPELYFGYKLAQFRNNLGSDEGFQPGRTVSYAEPDSVDLHKFYVTGDWKNNAENMELVSETGSIKLLYMAKEANIVTDKDARLQITLDGQPISEADAGPAINSRGVLEVSEPNLYNIVSSQESGTHMMEISVTGKGFQIFTFTFG